MNHARIHPKEEMSLVIVKPDALLRGLVGEIIQRFERKGLRIVGLRMVNLSEVHIDSHYGHHKEKPFFAGLSRYMRSSPVVLMVVSGLNAIQAVRLLVGPTRGHEAPAGTIRGDFSISGQMNIVHASDSTESANAEIERFFKNEDLFSYVRPDFKYLSAEDDLA